MRVPSMIPGLSPVVFSVASRPIRGLVLLASLLFPASSLEAQWNPAGTGQILYEGNVSIGSPGPGKLWVKSSGTPALGIRSTVGTAGPGTKYAIYGAVYGAQDYAGYFSGRGYFSGSLGIGIAPSQALVEIADLFAAGGKNLQIGNDTFFTDIDTANILGLYGVQDSTIAGFKLGSFGPTLFGRNGNLGIGTFNPLERLQIGERFTLHDGGTKVLGYNFRWNGNDTRIGQGGVATIRFGSDGGLQLITAPDGAAGSAIVYPSTGLTLTPDGRVGIGYASPQALVEIADLYSAGGRNLQIGNDTFFSDIDRVDTLGLHGSQDSTRAALQLGSVGPTLAGRSGNLGIGTETPGDKLEVVGNLRLTGANVAILSDGNICIGKCQ